MARKWWTLIAVCTGVFMLLLDITIVNVALPDIQRAFSGSLSDLQWVIDAYALTLAAFLLTAGSTADRLGRRRMFAIGIVVFTLGSALCGGATGIVFLSLARALQGIGGAIMFAISLALLAQAFKPSERGVAFGAFGALTGVAVAIGPVLGGVITSGLSWRWIFFVNIPIGLVALLVTLLRVDESRSPVVHQIDWWGCVLFSVALAALVFGLIRSQADGWTSTTVLGSLIASVVLLAVFVLVESRLTSPMFDLGLLRIPTFNGGLVAAWGVSASIFAILTYLVLYLQNILGYSALQTGLRFLPLSGAIFVVAAIAGRLSSVMPVRWLIAPGFVLVGIGLLLMRGVEPGQSWTHLLPGLIVSGAGAGLINPPLASTAVGVVAPQSAGMASGINSTLRQVGIATGVAALGSILTSRIHASVIDQLSAGPLAGSAGHLASDISAGRVPAAIATTPPQLRPDVIQASEAAFASALNDILLVTAIVALAAAVLSFVLIRSRDFVGGDERPADEPADKAKGARLAAADGRA
jgi:EmrB/QacA subfamily drug resistance transporter